MSNKAPRCPLMNTGGYHSNMPASLSSQLLNQVTVILPARLCAVLHFCFDAYGTL